MCDTIVATSVATKDGSVIFAKNSDREPNEAQIIEYHPEKKYKDKQNVKCTYISIPQVEKTRAVLISRPFWMWGAEIGANDAGVAIGNEAVFTKLPMTKDKKLTGMDLLRLALERADSAEAALDVITDLLEKYGQGGPCGYEDKNLTYHNSYIIADPKGAWVLETADRFWAAQKVNGVRSISNGLTITNKFDKASPGLVEHAIEKGWCKSERDFNFARCYSDWFFTTFSMCARRQGRTMKLVSSSAGNIDVSSMMDFLRDHGTDDDGDYLPQKGLFMNKVCMHAANILPRNSHSTASVVSHLTGDINTHWITGTSTPCESVFKPFYFEAGALPDIGPEPKGTYDERSLWWRHERLQRAVNFDYPTRTRVFFDDRDSLERRFIEDDKRTISEIKSKGKEEKQKRLKDLSKNCFDAADRALTKWTKEVLNKPVKNRASGLFLGYWKKQNKKAEIPKLD